MRAQMAQRMKQIAAKTYTISLANRKARGAGHERLAEILAAAKALFLESGYDNVSTRKIAARVGISQTALFSYYKTREDILVQLIQETLGDLGRGLAEIDHNAKDPEDWLRRCAAAYVAFGLNHPGEYRLAFMTIKSYRTPSNRIEPDICASIPPAGFEVFQAMEKRVADAIKKGVLRKGLGSPTAVTQVLWGALHGLVALLIAHPYFPWEDRADLVRIQIDTIVAGLLSRR
jgi:AcrR family transcriptional regulator